MKIYNNLYKSLCSFDNLFLAYKKARKRKAKKPYVIKFESNLLQELKVLQQELESLTYEPRPLKKFIIRDPKTRTIHSSDFRDRVVHHALVRILNPIFEKSFIFDSYASRLNKGTHNCVLRFDQFKRKVSSNGKLIKNFYNKNSVSGYLFKADIKHYFDTVNQKILLKIISQKIKDEKVIWLIKQILNNFPTEIKGIGMPLGNVTSQFFANIYLNELDYFVKHNLKAKYYIRYVDDFVIFHKDKEMLKIYKNKIESYLKNLKLELHQFKSKIIPLRNGLTFLGYRVFYHYKLLRKTNLRKFNKTFNEKLLLYKNGILSKEKILQDLQGWFGYSMWANTYRLRSNIINKLAFVK